jgi:hypothetical protein
MEAASRAVKAGAAPISAPSLICPSHNLYDYLLIIYHYA